VIFVSTKINVFDSMFYSVAQKSKPLSTIFI